MHIFCKPANPFIRDMDRPSCTDCMYYRPESNSIFSKCSQFGAKDLLTGDILLDYADSARQEELKCGKSGKEFKPVPQYKRFLPAIAIMGLLFSIL